MPAMTMTEKILARHADKSHVEPGDNIWVDTDILMTHDVCGPGTIGVFKQHFGKDAKVWDRDKVVIIPDHYIFTADRMANRNVDVLRQFVAEQNLPYFYDVGTPKYKGVIAQDKVTLDYVDARNAGKRPYTPLKSDAGAKFCFEKTYDVTKMEPVVAKPHSPDNRASVSQVRGEKLDRAYIGSCTGGKMTDFRAAARILHGHTVKIDTFVVPATSEIAAQLKTERLNGQTLE